MRPEAFQLIRQLARQRAGFVLEPTKEYLLESRLVPFAKERGLASLDDLLVALLGADEQLKDEVVEALTINETSFFRDPASFDELRTRVLPELLEQRRDSKQLRIWCAASSSGQEPYSVAMMLAEHFPEVAGWHVDILATDLCAAMLRRCDEGHYSELEVSRGLSEPLRTKYFEPDARRWRIVPCLRSRVRFERQNLIRPLAAVPIPLDLVLIRNVLIYFDEDTKLDILTRIRRHMAPGGVLMLGSGEFARGTSFDRVLGDNGAFYRAA